LELSVFATAEVMLRANLIADWQRGELLSVADRREFLLLELPHNLFLDLRQTVKELSAVGLRPILAHPERTPELLHETGKIEALIKMGCLVQVSAKSITEPSNRRDERAVRDWVRRGVVHLLGSDGHSLHRRPPVMAAAVEKIRHWAGDATADRIGSTLGLAILTGLPVRVPPTRAPSRRWWARSW
jgi:protein-tyrosine phosphatase